MVKTNNLTTVRYFAYFYDKQIWENFQKLKQEESMQGRRSSACLWIQGLSRLSHFEQTLLIVSAQWF